MANVWFRCNGKNTTMFRLNAFKELDYVPIIGDVVDFQSNDIHNASFRVKPYMKHKKYKNSIIKDCVPMKFKVVSRELRLFKIAEWELICEPTSESLLFLLKSVKTKQHD